MGRRDIDMVTNVWSLTFTPPYTISQYGALPYTNDIG
jgi:hypothetical protein